MFSEQRISDVALIKQLRKQLDVITQLRGELDVMKQRTDAERFQLVNTIRFREEHIDTLRSRLTAAECRDANGDTQVMRNARQAGLIEQAWARNKALCEALAKTFGCLESAWKTCDGVRAVVDHSVPQTKRDAIRDDFRKRITTLLG